MTSNDNSAKRRNQAERKAASSSAILKAAIELIALHGSKVPIEDIAHQAGFSQGLIMARFGSKAGLIKAVTHEVQLWFSAGLSLEESPKEGLEALHVVIDTFFQQMAEGSVSARAFYVLLGEATGPNQAINRLFETIDETFRQFISAILDKGKERNEITPDVDPDEMSAVIVGMLRGIALQRAVNMKAFDLQKAKHQVLLLLSALISGEKK